MLIYETFTLKYIVKYTFYTLVFHMCTIKYILKCTFLVHMSLYDTHLLKTYIKIYNIVNT